MILWSYDSIVLLCEWDSYPGALKMEEMNLHRDASAFLCRKETIHYESRAPFWDDSLPKLHLIGNFSPDVQLPQLPMLQLLAMPMQGCPQIQAELNAGKVPARLICNWKGERGKWEQEWKSAQKESWKESHLHQGFHTSKLGRDTLLPAAHRSRELTALPRAIRNKSKPGHSDAWRPQVIIAVLSIWKINTQNTWKARLHHCTLLKNSCRWSWSTLIAI